MESLKQQKKVQMNRVALIDFDGTIAEHDYPDIGKPLPGAFDTLRDMQKAGWILVLWTCREDGKRKFLTEAIEFCREHGLEFDAINETPLEYDFREGVRRKPYAHVHIDDRNLGGFPGWDIVRKLLAV